jgi:hypothetical protein
LPAGLNAEMLPERLFRDADIGRDDRQCVAVRAHDVDRLALTLRRLELRLASTPAGLCHGGPRFLPLPYTTGRNRPVRPIDGRLFRAVLKGSRIGDALDGAEVEQLRKGDVLVVTRLDRLARSTSELLRIAERLTEKNAGLRSLDEPWADTTSPSGRMVMTIFAGIAEFERTLIISRTSDGRLAAKARGVTFGRPKKMRPDQQELARELVRDGKSISAVARTFDVHPATIYRVIEG